MPENNGISEHDKVTHHYSVGAGIKAAIFFVVLVVTFGAGWYLCKQNTKGDIAESELEVRKDDSNVAQNLERKQADGIDRVNKYTNAFDYRRDCADLSIHDLRGVREPEVDQP